MSEDIRQGKSELDRPFLKEKETEISETGEKNEQ